MKKIRPYAAVFLSALFIYLIIKDLNLSSVKDAVVNANIFFLFVAFIALILSFTVRVYRWNLMLRAKGKHISMRESSWPFMVGAGLNSIMPLRIGDVVRVVAFKKRLRSTPSELMAVILLERMFDMFALLIIFLIGVSNLNDMAIPSAYITSAKTALLLTVVGFIVLILAPHKISVFIHWIFDKQSMRFITKKIKLEKIIYGVEKFVDTVESLGSMVLISKLALLSLLTWSIEGAMFYMVAESLMMGDLGYGAWFAFSMGSLSTILPSGPGFIGTLDYFVMIGITAYGAEWDQAAGFALLAHFLMIVPLAIIAIIYMIKGNKVRVHMDVEYEKK